MKSKNTISSSDIRHYTRVIVWKNGEYLQCNSKIRGGLVWSTSPWDAWWTRNADDAREVAKLLGGVPVLFNPVVGRTEIL